MSWRAIDEVEEEIDMNILFGKKCWNKLINNLNT